MPGLKQKKRQQILIIILIIAVIAVAITWYLNTQEKSIEVKPSEQQPVAGLSINEERLAEIKIDFSIFEDPLFKSLQSHGLLPVTVEEAGNENPFKGF